VERGRRARAAPDPADRAAGRVGIVMGTLADSEEVTVKREERRCDGATVRECEGSLRGCESPSVLRLKTRSASVHARIVCGTFARRTRPSRRRTGPSHCRTDRRTVARTVALSHQTVAVSHGPSHCRTRPSQCRTGPSHCRTLVPSHRCSVALRQSRRSDCRSAQSLSARPKRLGQRAQA